MSQGRLEWVSDSEGQMEVEKPRIINGDAEAKKWSEQMMTVDCLRKRLVAERTASKAAKENAQVMEEKLTELEKLLKMEIEAKERAEKKLKLAMKKLKNLKLTPCLSQSDTTEDRDSSPPPRTGMKEERGEVTDLSTSQDSEANISEDSHNIFVNQVTSQEGRSRSAETRPFDNTEVPSEDDGGKVTASDVPRLCPIGGDNDLGRGEETDEVDNPLALVLVPEQKECLEHSPALVMQQSLPPFSQNCVDSAPNRLCPIGGDNDLGPGEETEEVDNSLALVLVPEQKECLEHSPALVMQQGLPPFSQNCGDSAPNRLCPIGGDNDLGPGEETEEVDNPLALVLVLEQKECLEHSPALVIQQGLPPFCQNCGDSAPRTKDIYEALVALQRAKAHLQSSIETRAAVYSSHSLELCGYLKDQFPAPGYVFFHEGQYNES